ncbi:short-chain dehydrogenase/reductase 2 [Thelonectria olida]|uniref:Short-chain dehydrogenase/reductase 3 n=1 Tax=Thelonectria olida TaxID=1576542 RepID=A0A9P9ARZ6_9HYPO|nr:short-chain dehydrogenase/reductase 2 [Thelonectria olida]
METLRSYCAQFDLEMLLASLQNLGANQITQRTIGTLIACGLAFKLNSVLSDWALGNLSTNRPWDWNREIVLITGGSSGIGEQVALRLAERNIKVIIFDLNAPKTSGHPNIFFYKVDVTSKESVGRAAKALREEVGEPTVLVNNAGIGHNDTILSGTEESIQRTFAVNSIAHFTLAREFLPSMIEHDHGHVVTMASMASFVALAANVDYSCSKAAAMAFHEGLRQELVVRFKVKHVRTSIIHPLWVRTPMNSGMHERLGSQMLDVGRVADRIVKQILDGKSGRVLIPSHLWVAPLVRGFPDWVQEWVRGSQASMVPT